MEIDTYRTLHRSKGSISTVLKTRSASEGPNDILYIDFVQQKTGRAVTVGILDPLIKSILLEEFPTYSYSQLFNMYIKQICKLAGVTKKGNGL